MRKDGNEVLTVATVAARNADEAVVGSAFSRSLDRRPVGFCVGAFGMNLASVGLKTFLRLILL
jgi:hypothetical protein